MGKCAYFFQSKSFPPRPSFHIESRQRLAILQIYIGNSSRERPPFNSSPHMYTKSKQNIFGLYFLVDKFFCTAQAAAASSRLSRERSCSRRQYCRIRIFHTIFGLVLGSTDLLLPPTFRNVKKEISKKFKSYKNG